MGVTFDDKLITKKPLGPKTSTTCFQQLIVDLLCYSTRIGLNPF
jgi:hypothetical protein